MIGPLALEWLTHDTGWEVLHIFDEVCNIVNHQRNVVSLVSPTIGAGPFNLVVEPPSGGFTQWITATSSIQAKTSHILLGEHTFDYGSLWGVQPRWEYSIDLNWLYSQLCEKGQHSLFANPPEVLVNSLHPLAQSIIADDADTFKDVSLSFVGWGGGLTPAGDDFMMGILYALHNNKHPLANTMLSTSMTTALSASWLYAAGQGYVSESWLHFLNDHTTINNLLRIGDTSGADALWGFWFGLEALS